MTDIRKTIRWNNKEWNIHELGKQMVGIDNDSEFTKFAENWLITYLKNVTETFFPADYDVIIQRKRKTFSSKLKVYHKK